MYYKCIKSFEVKFENYVVKVSENSIWNLINITRYIDIHEYIELENAYSLEKIKITRQTLLENFEHYDI